jgi:hypothetical protein
MSQRSHFRGERFHCLLKGCDTALGFRELPFQIRDSSVPIRFIRQRRNNARQAEE